MAVKAYVVLLFTIVIIVTKVAAQVRTTARWNQFCDEGLDACIKTYTSNIRNRITTNEYYDCVYTVFCERWSTGYYYRQDILGVIQAMKEHFDPGAAEWWRNGSCRHETTLAVMAISLFVMFKVVYFLSR